MKISFVILKNTFDERSIVKIGSVESSSIKIEKYEKIIRNHPLMMIYVE